VIVHTPSSSSSEAQPPNFLSRYQKPSKNHLGRLPNITTRAKNDKHYGKYSFLMTFLESSQISKSFLTLMISLWGVSKLIYFHKIVHLLWNPTLQEIVHPTEVLLKKKMSINESLTLTFDLHLSKARLGLWDRSFYFGGDLRFLRHIVSH